MKSVLASTLFGLTCLALPIDDSEYLVGRDALPQFGASVNTNLGTNVGAGVRVAAAVTPGNSDGSSSYYLPILAQHNNHRANHSAQNINWDTGLASTAQKIAVSCNYAHNTAVDGGGYGQNIGAGFTPSQVPVMLTNYMYNGEVNYYPGYTYPNGKDPDFSQFGRWGHFSQIVWASTTKVGCYTQYCPNGLAGTSGNVKPYFTVCNYSPPGNFGGRYAANVLAPRGNPTVVV